MGVWGLGLNFINGLGFLILTPTFPDIGRPDGTNEGLEWMISGVGATSSMRLGICVREWRVLSPLLMFRKQQFKQRTNSICRVAWSGHHTPEVAGNDVSFLVAIVPIATLIGAEARKRARAGRQACCRSSDAGAGRPERPNIDRVVPVSGC